MPTSDPMRARLEIRLPVELLLELQADADKLGVEMAVVARAALRHGHVAAFEQLQREIEEHQLADADLVAPRRA